MALADRAEVVAQIVEIGRRLVGSGAVGRPSPVMSGST
jgi:hypothetical protein